jgi:hypothetical protein
MSGLSVLLNKDKGLPEQVSAMVRGLTSDYSMDCEVKEDIIELFFHLNVDIKETKLLKLFDYLLNLANEGTLVSTWSDIRIEKKIEYIRYGCYFLKIRQGDDTLSFPEPRNIRADYVKQIGDKVFIIYKKSMPIFTEFKLTDEFKIIVTLKNYSQTFSVVGNIYIKKAGKKDITTVSMVRAFQLWHHILLSVESSDLDIVKSAVTGEYENKGYQVVSVEIMKERYTKRLSADEVRKIYYQKMSRQMI